MAKQRFTIKLTQLRCIKESDPGPSEPYIWVTYFAHGPQLLPFETGPLSLNTPSYDAFRTEFASMSAGDVVNVPTFIASASFDMDLSVNGAQKFLGCVAVLMEEDDTRQNDIVFGRIAYTKEMEKQLNIFFKNRLHTLNNNPPMGPEIDAIKSAVTSAVKNAVASHQGIFDILRDQDDPLGFTYQFFDPSSVAQIALEQSAKAFDFPEITTTKKVNIPRFGISETTITDRYLLSGEVTVTAVPPDTVEGCGAQREALEAQQKNIKGLHVRVSSLQQQLQHAPHSKKASITQQIAETNSEIVAAEAHLPALEAALRACMNGLDIHIDPPDIVVSVN